MSDSDCLTLDYLEFFCERNNLLIGCWHEAEEVWISRLGPHPSDLSLEQLRAILGHTPQFELRPNSLEPSSLETSKFLTRSQLSSEIRRIVN